MDRPDGPHELFRRGRGGSIDLSAAVWHGSLRKETESMLNRTVAADGRVMNGAESLVRTLVAGGVDVCFANPGTSEMHFVAALDRVEGMRCVLGLFEGVVTGAA